MFVRLREGGALPIALNARYVRRLVRELDLGTQYQGLIKTMLAPGREGVALRQQQFAEQLAVQMLEQAMRQKLQDPEFETAYRYICHVISMPDGAAREALDRLDAGQAPGCRIGPGEKRKPILQDGCFLHRVHHAGL